MKDASQSALWDCRPVVVLSDNSCRNLLHFRGALLTALQDEGFRLVVLAGDDEKSAELRSRGIELCPLVLSRASTNPLLDARLLLRYISLLRRKRPAAFCSFTIKPNVYGGIAARVCGVPVIATVTGLGTAFLAGGVLWRIAEGLYRAAFKRARAVFFHNSDDLRAFVREQIVSGEQARLIPGSGIDLERFRSTGQSRKAESKLLFVGRLIRDKGIREFIDAARVLRSKYPTVRFLLLGDVDQGNRTSVAATELRAWVAEGLVEHLGNHEDIIPFAEEATAVVLPSYREGMSRALLEAAALGKPLVGSDVPGVRELVQEGVTGALCEPRDSQSLASALERIVCASPDTLQIFGRNARRIVEAQFSESRVVGAYLNVLRQIGRSAPHAGSN